MPIPTFRSPRPNPLTRFAGLLGIGLFLFPFLPSGTHAQPPPCRSGWENTEKLPEYSSPPVIIDRMQVFRVLAAEYPRKLKKKGIGGSTRILFLVDTLGAVWGEQTRVSSGNEALDQAGLRVVRVLEFLPALLDDRKLCMWMEVPIHFPARGR